MFMRSVLAGLACLSFAPAAMAESYSEAVRAALSGLDGISQIEQSQNNMADLINIRDTSLTKDVAAQAPVTFRWEGKEGAPRWTQAGFAALSQHAAPLSAMIPRDIHNWCPAYATAPKAQRDMFWVGLVSTISKHESTYRETVEGGEGKYIGLMQIAPQTAALHGCRATTAASLKNGGANVSCALRIMAKTVVRDQVVSEDWKGVAKDWGPFHVKVKRHDMKDYMNAQPYCTAGGAMPVAPAAASVSAEQAQPFRSTERRANVPQGLTEQSNLAAVLLSLELANKQLGQ